MPPPWDWGKTSNLCAAWKVEDKRWWWWWCVSRWAHSCSVWRIVTDKQHFKHYHLYYYYYYLVVEPPFSHYSSRTVCLLRWSVVNVHRRKSSFLSVKIRNSESATIAVSCSVNASRTAFSLHPPSDSNSRRKEHLEFYRFSSQPFWNLIISHDARASLGVLRQTPTTVMVIHWCLSSAMSSNDDWPVLSLMLSLHDLRSLLLRWLPYSVPCSMNFSSVWWRHTWPNHDNLRSVTVHSKSSWRPASTLPYIFVRFVFFEWYAKHLSVAFVFEGSGLKTNFF